MRISLTGIGKSYGEVFAVKDFNLTIPEGQFLTLLGPSGCGKTTVLRILAGLEIPDEGEIFFDEQCFFSSAKKIYTPPEKRNLGFVFQNFSLWPHLTVEENVAFPLEIKGIKVNKKELVEEALAAVRLAEYGNRYPHQLSGGQQQRVAFARAISAQPSCILFDEPLSALDAVLRDAMQTEIKRLVSERNITAVFVTHDQSEALSMSDRIVVMNGDTIEQAAEPEILYHQPQTAFVAQFVGKSNWLDEKHMFRPEAVIMEKRANSEEFNGIVEDCKYVGNVYELTVKVKTKNWKIRSPIKYGAGAGLEFFLPLEGIITI